MVPSDLKKLRQLEQENKRLKEMVADLSLDKHMLQEVLSKKGLNPPNKREIVHSLIDEYRIGVRRACRVIQIPRSTFYYILRKDEKMFLRMKIRDYALARVRYGYQRIHILL